jgi:Fur family ferric uptake transcriptional regulator
MTAAPSVSALSYENIDDAIEALRQRGLRLSMIRARLLEELFAVARPLSAEDLALRLGLVSTSVYRNLETLERHGVLRHVHLGHGPGLYVLMSRGEREYIYCPDCRTARTVRPDLLDPVRLHIRRRFGYHVSFTHFALIGRCSRCADDHDEEPTNAHNARLQPSGSRRVRRAD